MLANVERKDITVMKPIISSTWITLLCSRSLGRRNDTYIESNISIQSKIAIDCL